jgi:hypothetical protein
MIPNATAFFFLFLKVRPNYHIIETYAQRVSGVLIAISFISNSTQIFQQFIGYEVGNISRERAIFSAVSK